MQTRFSPEELTKPEIASAEQILRKCVHCGFCIATCPTYVLLGDELDSPRGRIYLIKDMLEQQRAATADVVQHIDRCLSCLACMTTCPSGVHYQHLIDHARVHVERTYRRPLGERWLRAMLAFVLPYPARFRWALRFAVLARPFGALLPARLRAMLALAPRRLPGAARSDSAAHPPPSSALAPAPRGARRVALLDGCVQSIVGPQINAATERLLRRLGIDVVTLPGCCGSIVHHLGRDGQNRDLAARLIERLHAEHAARAFDAIVVNASGCGTHLKDYGHIFRSDPALADKARQISALTRDVTEFLAGCELPPTVVAPGLRVAYHSACSMQHGQKIERAPRELLARTGFAVEEIAEGHLCCGSAGTYNMLQPEIAGRLRERKLANIARTQAQLVATGNIGCITQLAASPGVPVIHTVELLDWATGGPTPVGLRRFV
jgi:glycolate oxidase iron-sulfur subunit